MSEYLRDSGHHWMHTCDACGGAFGCAAPDDEEAEPAWTCETCAVTDAEIARLRAQAVRGVRRTPDTHGRQVRAWRRKHRGAGT